MGDLPIYFFILFTFLNKRGPRKNPRAAFIASSVEQIYIMDFEKQSTT
jgi:hypothetical protein